MADQQIGQLLDTLGVTADLAIENGRYVNIAEDDD